MFRQALGVQQTPPNQVLNGVGLLMTLYIMFPTGLAMYTGFARRHDKCGATSPHVERDRIRHRQRRQKKPKSRSEAFCSATAAESIFRVFISSLTGFFPNPYKTNLKSDDFIILVPSFITSPAQERLRDRRADLLAIFRDRYGRIEHPPRDGDDDALLRSRSPCPIKLLLLVIVDGWTVLIQGLAMSFR